MLWSESEKNTLLPVGECKIFHVRLKKQEDENWYRCDVVVTTTKETVQNQIHCSDRPKVHVLKMIAMRLDPQISLLSLGLFR